MWTINIPRRPATHLLATASFSLVLILGTGCSSPPMSAIVDLGTASAGADIQWEPVLIDCGTPAARIHLVEGWSHDERHRADGYTFVWSEGEASEIQFFLGWRRRLEVLLRGRPFRNPGAGTQRVRVHLNGMEIDSFEMTDGPAVYSVEMPAETQQIGENRLTLSYSWCIAPAVVIPTSKDLRRLAVAWQSIEFVGSGLIANPNQTGVGEPPIEVLPLGARADYFFDLPAESRLRLSGLVFKGQGSAELVITALPDKGQEVEVARLRSPHFPEEFLLPPEAGLMRLRFSVIPGTEGAAGRLRMEAPTIHAPHRVPTAKPSSSFPWRGPERPNLIIYLVDALRADRLGCYGNRRPVSPRIDAFANEAILFENAIAQSSWTKAAVASIFTGLWPVAHGTNGPDSVLPPEVRTLPEALSSAGYATAAVIANAFVSSPFGFSRGFDQFKYLKHGHGSSENVNEQVFDWIASQAQEPFFLYVHTIDPHAPYAAPQPFLSKYAGDVPDPTVGEVETVRGLVLGKVTPSEELTKNLESLYDAEIAHNDAGFGAFIDFLDSNGLLDNSVVLFTSDHGEAFGEHQTWTHGIDLYAEVIEIPMIMRLPKGSFGGTQTGQVVQHIDIVPTFLSLAEISSPSPGRGQNLLASSGIDRWAASYLDYWGQNGASIVTDRWKYIFPLSIKFGRKAQLFDRHEDPGEHNNLATQRPVVAGFLASKLRAELGKNLTAPMTAIDESTRSDLKALGYLN